MAVAGDGRRRQDVARDRQSRGGQFALEIDGDIVRGLENPSDGDDDDPSLRRTTSLDAVAAFIGFWITWRRRIEMEISGERLPRFLVDRQRERRGSLSAHIRTPPFADHRF